jgi:hypothetical protein
MHNLAEAYVLMIEPDKEGHKSERPVEDNLTMVVDMLMEKCTFKDIRYKGIHTTNCGEYSDNKDLITQRHQKKMQKIFLLIV